MFSFGFIFFFNAINQCSIFVVRLWFKKKKGKKSNFRTADLFRRKEETNIKMSNPPHSQILLTSGFSNLSKTATCINDSQKKKNV